MAHVLLHSLVFAPDSVSTAFLMTDLARQLRASGNTVTVLTTTPHYNRDPESLARQPLRPFIPGLLSRSVCDGIPVWHVRVPMKGNRVITRVLDYLYFHAVSLLIGIIFIRRYDLVFTPSPPLTMGVVGWLLGVFRGVPSVYNVQEIYPDFAVKQGLIRNPAVISLLRRMERFVYARSAAVVTISPWFTRVIEGRGVPRSRLATIPNFVDTEIYRPLPRRNPFAERHGLLDAFVVLYGGNVGLSQDWESFLHAAAVHRGENILFVVAGNGVRTEWLSAEVTRRDLQNVRLLGYQPRLSMPEVNASADVCTIPMKTGTTIDTFPSKIYTIMACARSVIVQADPDSELEWLVQSCNCGRVVPPDAPDEYAAAVRRAYEERRLLAAEGERGRHFVEARYSKEAVGAQYAAFLRELTGRG